jgi:hypothetical protein
LVADKEKIKRGEGIRLWWFNPAASQQQAVEGCSHRSDVLKVEIALDFA